LIAAQGSYLLGKYSFTKADRILSRSDFIRLSKTGKKIQNRHFIITFLTGRFERTRLGITVSKKVGKAVTRNRIKRYAREYFRRNRHHMTKSWDIQLIAKKEAADLSSKETVASLENIFRRIEIF
jgi:ribonuclease P protein component